MQIFLPNFAFFTVKSPSVTQWSVSQQNLTIIWVMVWVCGNVCKRLPQFWSKRREMHKKGREKPEEGSKLSSKSANGLRQKVQKTGIFELFWPFGNVCKRLPQFWSKRREMHKKGREKLEEGSKLLSKSTKVASKSPKNGYFWAILALDEYLAHAQWAAQI